jgi:voltage-gated potassium channel
LSEIKNNYLYNHIKVSVFLILTIICIGTSVYYFVFNFTMINAFYMTVITLGTVGYGETEPLNSDGRIFTSFLILFGIFIFAYAFSVLSAYLVSKNINFNLKKRKMENVIKAFKGHTIVCGFGRNGSQAAARLKAYKKDFVVIDESIEAIAMLEKEGMLYIIGNATEDDILIQAGIKNASHLITCLPQDTDNVFIVLTAKQLNPKLKVISRASDDSSVKKLKIAGANNIIMPDKIGGDHMASLVVTPDLVEFLDNLSISTSSHMNIQEIILSRLPHIKYLEELNIKERTGCTIMGYKKGDGTYVINPDLTIPVDAHGRIIVLGNHDQISKLNAEFKIL